MKILRRTKLGIRGTLLLMEKFTLQLPINNKQSYCDVWICMERRKFKDAYRIFYILEPGIVRTRTRKHVTFPNWYFWFIYSKNRRGNLVIFIIVRLLSFFFFAIFSFVDFVYFLVCFLYFSSSSKVSEFNYFVPLGGDVSKYKKRNYPEVKIVS